MKNAMVCLILLQAVVGSAATPSFLLGFDYSEAFGFGDQPPTALAIDGANAIYMLSGTWDATKLPPLLFWARQAGLIRS
jgi:hypothetical protein